MAGANMLLGVICSAVREQTAEAALLARQLANRQESASPWVVPCSGLSFADLPPSSSLLLHLPTLHFPLESRMILYFPL